MPKNWARSIASRPRRFSRWPSMQANINLCCWCWPIVIAAGLPKNNNQAESFWWEVLVLTSVSLYAPCTPDAPIPCKLKNLVYPSVKQNSLWMTVHPFINFLLLPCKPLDLFMLWLDIGRNSHSELTWKMVLEAIKLTISSSSRGPDR